ncbi:hypothetical protein NKG05_18520 [Oerskovia sp. M15]
MGLVGGARLRGHGSPAVRHASRRGRPVAGTGGEADLAGLGPARPQPWRRRSVRTRCAGSARRRSRESCGVQQRKATARRRRPPRVRPRSSRRRSADRAPALPRQVPSPPPSRQPAARQRRPGRPGSPGREPVERPRSHSPARRSTSCRPPWCPPWARPRRSRRPSIPPLAATQIIANDGRTVAVPTIPPVSPLPGTSATPGAAVRPALGVPGLPADLGPHAPQPAPGAGPAVGQDEAARAPGEPVAGDDPLFDAFGKPLDEAPGGGYARPAPHHRTGTVLALGLPLVLLAGSHPGWRSCCSP